jgi:hypothetical protein
MGTNYYRVPTVAEMEQRKEKLQSRVAKMDLSPANIEQGFPVEGQEDLFDQFNPWQEYVQDTQVHLGKRSGGWQFCWNFHDNKYYSTKEELFAFIRSGRVVNEYGEELDPDEFIKMAIEWYPNGLIHNEAYEKEHDRGFFWGPKYWDREVDGLRVSTSTEFS